jgi:hypothetical protein
MKRAVFEKIAKEFIEYLKDADFSQAFKFTLNDGLDDYNYGIKLIDEFDNWIFVTSMYGDGSGASVSVLTFEDDWDMKPEDWDEQLDTITDYLLENYESFLA